MESSPISGQPLGLHHWSIHHTAIAASWQDRAVIIHSLLSMRHILLPPPPPLSSTLVHRLFVATERETGTAETSDVLDPGPSEDHLQLLDLPGQHLCCDPETALVARYVSPPSFMITNSIAKAIANEHRSSESVSSLSRHLDNQL